jgi:RNA polymerase sigma factor (sigma-70 family)
MKERQIMKFEELLENFSPLLKRMAKRFKGNLRFLDEEDLVQEMLFHLWKQWKSGKCEDKTFSYIAQSCWFYLQNYLRRFRDKVSWVSLDELQSFPDKSSPPLEVVERKIIIERIRGNGLTIREKEVFNLWLDGCTVREIGKRLRISHVRVVKIENNIRRKVEENH